MEQMTIDSYPELEELEMLNCAAFLEAMEEFRKYRSSIRRPLVGRGKKMLEKRCREWAEDAQTWWYPRILLYMAIENGWTAPHEPDTFRTFELDGFKYVWHRDGCLDFYYYPLSGQSTAHNKPVSGNMKKGDRLGPTHVFEPRAGRGVDVPA